jgi:RNA recognition motif-containing protein
MNIYVGNLSYKLSEDELRNAFAVYGEVTSARIITDRASGESKGFGFVEMANRAQAEEAIRKLDGTQLQGRAIRVNEARPKAEAPARDNGRGPGRASRF